MRRVGFLAFVVWCAGTGAVQAATLPVRPNILWLIIEDACPDFGCYGNKSVRTPNIDQFATESRRFTRAFATASVCSPSRSAFMTGRYQTSFGAHHHRSHRQDGRRRPADVRLITERMREAGYFTVNLRSLPPELGFAGAPKTDWNFHDDGRAFDGDKWADLKGRQPFYAQLNFQQTHRPYRKAEDNPVDPASVDLPGYLADDPVIRADWAAYLDEVGRVDAKVGAVLRRLEQDGLRDNTAVFLFADNGREDFRGKCYAYEQGFHVPLIVRWPAAMPPGSATDDLVSLLDVHATSLALAGINAAGLDGSACLLPGAARRDYIFAARDRIDETPDRVRTVRDPRYKYIRNFEPQRPYLQPMAYAEVTNPTYNRMRQLFAAGALAPAAAKFMAERRPVEELYDLQRDPFELHNLAADPAARSELARLRHALEAWMRATHDQGGGAEDPAAIQIEMERLDRSVQRMRQQLAVAEAPMIDGPPTSCTTRGLILFSDSLAKPPLAPSWRRLAGEWTSGAGATRGSAVRDAAATLHCEQPFAEAVIHFETRFSGQTRVGIQIADASDARVRLGLDETGLTLAPGGPPAATAASRPDSVPAPITGNQWHAVVLELVGESLVLAVDGRPALTTTWPARSRAGSRIEFLVDRGSAEFRNVRIWGATPRRDQPR